MISICQQDSMRWKSQNESSSFEEFYAIPRRAKMSFY
jgi:hypothetical protein